ncbi:MAG: SprB repeat-containing protein, partial [Bacteroidia bacterium]
MTGSLSRIYKFLLTLLVISGLKAQKLYWIGGSGDYNDPKHWSLTSGGLPAFQIPNKNTDVIFDEASSFSSFQVNFGKDNFAKNLQTFNYKKAISFNGNSSQVLYLNGGIQLTALVKFNVSSEIIFKSNDSKEHVVEFGLNKLKSNLYFNEGNYDIRALDIDFSHSVTFGSGFYKFHNSFINAANVYAPSQLASFSFENAFIKVSDKFKINSNANLNSKNVYVSTNYKDVNKFEAPVNLTNNATNKLMAFSMPICNFTITTSPSCSGPCTGVLTISFSPGCVDPPYNVLVNNPICPATAGTLTANNVTSVSSVYTASNACECASQNYQIVIFDGLGNFSTPQNINFIPNPVNMTSSIIQPSCATSCNGVMSGLIFGTSPFQVTVLPATASPNSFTTNLTYTVSNLCAGVYTFNIVDGDGCSTVITKTMTAPPPVNPNQITNSVSCNAACNGSIIISPTGGTPDYTVQFNPGGTFTVAAAGSASVTGLCPGLVTATVTDANGCTATTNTTISQPSALTVTPTQTNLTCFATCNGATSVAVTGGTSPYTYTWNPGPGNSAGITGLCAGTQTVDIEDGNGCPITQTFNITSPPAITLT